MPAKTTTSTADRSLDLVLEDQHEARVAGVRRITGLARFFNLLPLFDFIVGEAGEGKGSAEDKAFRSNPRFARAGRITAEIMKTLADAPDQFVLRSKGILLGASEYTHGDEGKWTVRFRGKHDGLADGGHTLLAIGCSLLARVLHVQRRRTAPDESQEERAAKITRHIRQIKDWPTFALRWREHREEVGKLAREEAHEHGVFSALLPVEVLLPLDSSERSATVAFRRNLIGVARSRNTNAQVQTSALINHAGLYEPLKKRLPPFVRDEVEWIAGDGGRLKADEIVSIFFIAVIRLENEGITDTGIRPRETYSHKATVLKRYERLVRTYAPSKSNDLHPVIEHPAIDSALEMVPTLLRLHDKIQVELPGAYNAVGGRYGSILAAAKKGASGGKASSERRPAKYSPDITISHDTPRGFLIPILNAFVALMDIEDGRLKWGMDPEAFLSRNAKDIARRFREGVVSVYEDNAPDRIGRNEANYSVMLDLFKILRLEEESGRREGA